MKIFITFFLVKSDEYSTLNLYKRPDDIYLTIKNYVFFDNKGYLRIYIYSKPLYFLMLYK